MSDPASAGFPVPVGDTPPLEPGTHERDSGLSVTERQILDTERRPWPSTGAKDLAIYTDLGLSPTRYYQILAALIDRPEALRYDPALVNRLRERRRVRAVRRAPHVPGDVGSRSAPGR